MYELTLNQQRRFMSNVEKGPDKKDCWIWTGRRTGRRDAPGFYLQYRCVSPRRIMFELEKRVELNHYVFLYPRCRNVRCVNPDHMYVTVRGGRMPDERCKRGHDMTDETNIYITTQGKRACKACIRITGQERRKRYLAEGRGWGGSYKKQQAA